MPLVMMSGFPCAGKTYRATQLVDYCEAKIAAAKAALGEVPADADASTEPKISLPAPLTPAQRRHYSAVSRLKVQLVNDESLRIDRAAYGVVGRDEKTARAAQMSAVTRALRRDVIVVADGMNYIKGYRYQMYCDAKSHATPTCVIHVGTPVDACRARNNARLAEDAPAEEKARAYPADVFENLVFRYEEPNGMTRWDSPLFVVAADDAEPALDKIWDAIVGAGPDGAAGADGDGHAGGLRSIKPNMATVLAPSTPHDALQALHAQTTAVLKAIQTFQADRKDLGSGAGEELAIPGCDAPLQLPVSPAPVPASQLQRLRRTFVLMRRKGGLVLGGGEKDGQVGHVGGTAAGKNGYMAGFVDFLNTEFENGLRTSY